MSKLRIGVVGANGKMGQEIAKAGANTLGIVRSGKAQGFHSTATKLDSSITKKVDVIIDFSSLDNFENVVEFCAKEKIPLISGTTGIGSKEKKILKKFGQKIPLLWSPNMSLGIAALKEALKALAALEKFDFQIEEFHHNKKKDNPSGTALYLQEALEKATSKKIPAPIGIRGGGIFGVHKVWAMSDNETLCFEHQALNRKVFAVGAIRAAEWIYKKSPRLYELKDVIAEHEK